jgi:excinuclease ABC subunit A
VKVDGDLLRDRRRPALDKKFKHDIDVVVDRVVVRDDIAARWPTASRPASAGRRPRRRRIRRQAAQQVEERPHERIVFSEKFACPVSGFTIPEIEPRLFSFNNPFGACPACDGLGVHHRLVSTRSSSCRTRRSRCTRRDRALGEILLALLHQTLDALGTTSVGFKISDWSDCRRRCRTRSCTAPATKQIDFL